MITELPNVPRAGTPLSDQSRPWRDFFDGLSGALENIENLILGDGAGILVRTEENTYTTRTLQDAENQIEWTYPDGVGGNPTPALPQDIDTDADVQFDTALLDSLRLQDSDASHYLSVLTTSDLTGNRTLALVPGDADRTITFEGDVTLDQDYSEDASVRFATLSLNNSGLHLLDTDASHDLVFAVGSDLTADKTLTFTTGDSDRTITLQGNPTLDDWFDQSVKTTVSPTFAGLITAYIKPAADSTTAIQLQKADGTSVLNVDTTNERIGVNRTNPLHDLHVEGAAVVQATQDGVNPVRFSVVNWIGGASTNETAVVTAVPGFISSFYNGPGIVGFRLNPGDLSIHANRTFGLKLQTTNSNSAVTVMTLLNDGKIGFATPTPTYDLSFCGNLARTVWLERHTTANTAGNDFTWQSGGATAAATDKDGGDGIFKSGIATGDGGSKLEFYSVVSGQGAGTTDRNPTLGLTLGDDVAFSPGGIVTTTKVIRGTTSLWYSSPQHVEISAANPGASGATWVPVGANNLRGWQLNADAEVLEFEGDVHSDWDEASDVEIKVEFESNIDNTAGNVADTTDFQLIAYYKGDGEIVNRTQTVTKVCTVGQIDDHEQHVCTILLDYEEVGNVIQLGDKFNFVFNLVTGTSEVADVTINHIHLRYKTANVGKEV